ncbi:MAG: anti-sigma factor [Bacteroidota bacterium]
MDSNNIISSDILQSYVLGTATNEEVLAVQQACRKHPELLAEIKAIEEALVRYAEMKAPPVSGIVKEKLFSNLNDKKSISNNSESKIYPINSPGSSKRFYRYAAAAAILLLIASAAFNLFFYNKVTSVTEELFSLKNENEKQQRQLENTKNDLAVLSDPLTKSIQLKSVDTTVNSGATIHWNRSTHQTYLSLAELPAPPEGKQYQLWAIVNGKPVDAGVFDVKAGIQKMKQINGAQAFAVTLENKGGSPVPTLTEMRLLGNV